ncbi:19952_t:CDS:2 [Racocetra fulgida]|uniref:19952_t:CDS:1 n=1 Tax=Racocetra fulgida TaxID=60492 RepID=A0A9N8Z0F1_9GLOM|nr:19952_t:CDS:2 [Racocetra fulgida]
MIENEALNRESLKTIAITVVTRKKKAMTIRTTLITLIEIKEECTEIKLLKEQQARKCKCDQIEV